MTMPDKDAVAGNFDPDLRKSSLASRTRQSAVYVGVAKTIRYSFVFLVQLVLMNLLHPSDFGLLRYITVILGIVNLINELGLSTAIVQRKTITDDELATAFTLNSLFSVLLYGIVFFAATLVASFFGNSRLILLIRIGTLAIPLGAASVIQQAVLRRRLQYGLLSLCEVLSALAGSLSALVMAYLGYGVWSLVGSMLVYSSVSMLLLFITGPWPSGSFVKFASARPLISLGIGVVGLHILEYLASNLDYLFVGKSFGEVSLGIYGFAFETIMLPRMAVSVIISSVAFSAFSRVQEDSERLLRSFLQLTLFVSILTIPFFAVVAAMPREITHAVSFIKHDAKWLPAALPLRIFAPMGLLYLLSTFNAIIWVARGRIRFCIWWNVAMLASVAVAVAAGSRFGVSGVCLAMLIRAIAAFPFILLAGKRIFGLQLRLYAKAVFPGVVAGTAAGVAMMSISAAVPGDSFQRHVGVLAAGSVSGVVMYAIILRIVFVRSFSFVREVIYDALHLRAPARIANDAQMRFSD